MSTRPRQWRAGLTLVALVLGSGLAGGLIGHRQARRAMEARNDPATWNEHVAKEFDRVVKPAPEQGARIQAHLDRAVGELQEIRRKTIERSTNVIWRLVSEVEKELTPEQLQAFQVMKPKPSELTLHLLDVSPR